MVFVFSTVGTGKTTGNTSNLVDVGTRFPNQNMLIIAPNSTLTGQAYNEAIGFVPKSMVSSQSRGKSFTLINGSSFTFVIADPRKKSEDYKSSNYSMALVIEGSSDFY